MIRFDLTGQRFGSLTVLGRGEMSPGGMVRWRCLCDCGNETLSQTYHLTKEAKGCRPCAARRSTRHGHRRSIDKPTRSASTTYTTWREIIRRCFRTSDSAYPCYGGRGITMCERWRYSFENFLADMGERPPGTTIDRIDYDGHYEPGNCRWADSVTQSHNRRATKLSYDLADEMRRLSSLGKSSASLAAQFGVSRSVVYRVLHKDPAKRKWVRP